MRTITKTYENGHLTKWETSISLAWPAFWFIVGVLAHKVFA